MEECYFQSTACNFTKSNTVNKLEKWYQIVQRNTIYSLEGACLTYCICEKRKESRSESLNQPFISKILQYETLLDSRNLIIQKRLKKNIHFFWCHQEFLIMMLFFFLTNEILVSFNCLFWRRFARQIFSCNNLKP